MKRRKERQGEEWSGEMHELQCGVKRNRMDMGGEKHERMVVWCG